MVTDMLGDKVLPESIQGRRRSLRTRLRDVRQPVRQRRMDLVPGPDIIGKAESSFMDLRSNLVERDTVLARIRERRSASNDGGSTDTTNNNTTSNQSGGTEMV